MDTKRLYVDFHVLQTVPPSCVNRDDTGSPKTAVYGGAVRARVSSQAWKHAMRVMFTEEMSGEVEIGKRTLRAIDLVADELAELLPGQDRKKLEKMSQDALKMAGITFKKSDKKDGEKSDNTSALDVYKRQRLLHGGQQSAGVAQKGLTGTGQAHGLANPVEQGGTQFRFQLGDLGGHRRLGVAQLPRCARKAVQLGNVQKGVDVAQFHSRLLSGG